MGGKKYFEPRQLWKSPETIAVKKTFPPFLSFPLPGFFFKKSPNHRPINFWGQQLFRRKNGENLANTEIKLVSQKKGFFGNFGNKFFKFQTFGPNLTKKLSPIVPQTQK